MSFTSISSKDFSKDGLIVLIEGNNPDKPWFNALPWQRDEFSKALQWGSMKSMCYPNEYSVSKPFEKDGFKYRFVIFDDWNPCFMINLTTKKIREVKYIKINKSKFKLFDTDEFLSNVGLSKDDIYRYNEGRTEH